MEKGLEMRNHPAKLTLLLSVFLLILLISIPFALSSEVYISVYAYLIYAVFLTCVGILIGSATTWLQLSKIESGRVGSDDLPPTISSVSAKNWNEAERRVIAYLLEKDDTAWQAQMAKDLGLHASKVSRLLLKLENKGVIERHRDGMSKRIVLIEEVEL